MKNNVFLLLFSVFVFLSCENETDPVSNDDVEVIPKASIQGLVQLGPFLNGTNVDVYELDDSMSVNGNDFFGQVYNNSGAYKYQNIPLGSPYVIVKAEGYYYNFCKACNSEVPIQLYSLASIQDQNMINVNVLTHIEKSRIEYLVLEEGMSFQDAKDQSKAELLKVFSFDSADVEDFELFDISKEGKGNAILLAVSIMMLENNNDFEFVKLLADFIDDFRTDGTLDNAEVSSQLINNAWTLKQSKIRAALEEKYSAIDTTISIPDFETPLQYFIDSTSFVKTNLISYVKRSGLGVNILYGEQDTQKSFNLSMAANVPKGAALKIVLKVDGTGMWVYRNDNYLNWSISLFDYTKDEQTFIVKTPGEADVNLVFEKGSYIIEYYEYGDEEPTRVKSFTI